MTTKQQSAVATTSQGIRAALAARRAKACFPPQSLQRESAALLTHFGLLTSRAAREEVCVCSATMSLLMCYSSSRK